MRSDIYYRLNVIPIRLIPLRQRLEDIPLLVQDFLHHHPISLQKKIMSASPQVIDQLMRYEWPGNIRELQNILEKAIVLSRSKMIEEIDLSDSLAETPVKQKKIAEQSSLAEWIKAQEKEYLISKLQIFGGRIDFTAKSCGVDVRTLHRKMRLYGLNKKTFNGLTAPNSFQLSHSATRAERHRDQF